MPRPRCSYLKDCGCFRLRNAVIAIAVIDIALFSYILFIGSVTLYNDDTLHPRNSTQAFEETTPHKSPNTGSIIYIVFACVNIPVSISLFLCAIFHNRKYKKVLYVWIAWTTVTIGLEFIKIMMTFVVGGYNWIGPVIGMVGILYESLCMWVVISYYKHLDIGPVNAPASGYSAFFDADGKELRDEQEDGGPDGGLA